MKLLISIPFSANDAVTCERNLDHIFRLNGKTQIGHVLLVSNPDCSEEMRHKIRITAELAFETVAETVAPAIDAQFANSKFHQMNNLFRHAALTVQNWYRWPWLWLEPDSVPMVENWIYEIGSAYERQPKKYMGMIAKLPDGKKMMMRVGVYYGGASFELDKLCMSGIPFPVATSERVVDSATHSDLFDNIVIETVEDLNKILPSAVVIHGDKMGIFSENWTTSLDNSIIQSEKFGRWRFLESNGEQEFNKSPITKEVSEGLSQLAVTPTVMPIQDEQQPRLTRRQKREQGIV